MTGALTPTAASLLGFLHDGPLSGWDLVAKAERTIGDFWNITKSQVYRELETLAAAGCVTQGPLGARARQPYAITARGRSAFVDWIAVEPGPLTMRWPLALTVYFGRHVPPVQLAAFLATHRAHHAALVSALTALEPGVQAAGDAHIASVLSLGARFHRLVTDWIDELAVAGARSRAARPPKRARSASRGTK